MQKREKYDTYFHKGGKKYKKISEIEIQKGIKYILIDMKLTKKRGFGRHNLAIYHKKNRNNKKYEDPWYILTSLYHAEEVIKVYIERNGIETMFKDCKTGGYNLEKSRANTQRLTNLILLIAIAYTNRALKGKKIKENKHQKYIARPEEKERKSRRHSDFRIGLYGQNWVDNYDYYLDEVTEIMELNQNKLKFYRKGLLALSKIREIYDLPLIN